jgi:hypothetical protein
LMPRELWLRYECQTPNDVETSRSYELLARVIIKPLGKQAGQGYETHSHHRRP